MTAHSLPEQSSGSPVYIGVDLGGTNIVAGAVGSGGSLLEKIKQPTRAERGSAAVLKDIAEMIGALAGKMRSAGLAVAAAGIGCPGFVDPNRGVCAYANNLGWREIPVADELSRLSGGLPVFADNDVRMYVYGEAVCGAGAGHGHVLGVTLGTGMACAFVDNGRLFYGGGCMAGEIGHILMDDIPYRCSCGQTGCLETAVSATGIARQAAEKLRAGADSLLRAKLGTGAAERVTAADVSAGYDEGDALCVEIMERTGMWLGRALAIACTFYSPDIVVIGGGASLAGERLLAPARKTMRERLLPELAARIAVTTAALTDDAGVIGSALFAGRQLQTRGG